MLPDSLLEPRAGNIDQDARAREYQSRCVMIGGSGHRARSALCLLDCSSGLVSRNIQIGTLCDRTGKGDRRSRANADGTRASCQARAEATHWQRHNPHGFIRSDVSCRSRDRWLGCGRAVLVVVSILATFSGEVVVHLRSIRVSMMSGALAPVSPPTGAPGLAGARVANDSRPVPDRGAHHMGQASDAAGAAGGRRAGLVLEVPYTQVGTHEYPYWARCIAWPQLPGYLPDKKR